MPEADPGSHLRTIRAMVQHQLRQTQTDTIRECLKRALTALDLAVAAEREGPQVASTDSEERASKIEGDVERLRSERNNARITADGFADLSCTLERQRDNWKARAEAAEAEVERLRELHKIACGDARRGAEYYDSISKALALLDATMTGCSDNGCALQWPRHKVGTNGGCHCLDGLRPEMRVKVRKRLKAGRDAIAALKGEATP